jgi:hypothetical protein
MTVATRIIQSTSVPLGTKASRDPDAGVRRPRFEDLERYRGGLPWFRLQVLLIHLSHPWLAVLVVLLDFSNEMERVLLDDLKELYTL